MPSLQVAVTASALAGGVWAYAERQQATARTAESTIFFMTNSPASTEIRACFDGIVILELGKDRSN